MTRTLIPASGELAGRSIPEWRGKTPDSAIPDRVKLRVVLRFNRKDAITGLPLVKGWHMDHIIPLKDWIATPEYPHGNVESNIQPVNAPVNTAKAADENRARKKVANIQKKVLSINSPKTKIASRPFQTRLKPDNHYDRLAVNEKSHNQKMASKGVRV